MNLEVPFNTQAKIILNQIEFVSLKINGNTFSSFDTNNKVTIVENTNVVLGSGVYEIKYQKTLK